MERGDWDNDADYPRAPLPAHERTWRHPSEIGAQHWVQSEPPLVVGRGLSVATGTVGAVLALGLLWLMVPHATGTGSSAATEGSSAARVISSTGSGDAAVGSATPGANTSVPATETFSASPTSVVTSPATDAAMMTSSPQVMSMPPLPTVLLADVDVTSEVVPPIAIALQTGHHVVTTAGAVRGRDGFAVRLPSGETVVGVVVAVDVANGTAVLSVDTEIDAATVEPSDADISSSTFMLMNPEATSASLWTDDATTMVAYDGGAQHTGEGSLVVDGDGRLMGMCTAGANGTHLVSVASLLDALALVTSDAMPAWSWLGIATSLDGDGRVVVTDVSAGGAAEQVGLAVGDVIVAIDGSPLADPEMLRSIVSAHVDGDTMVLTVAKAGGNVTAATANRGTSVPPEPATTSPVTTPATTATTTPATTAAPTSAPATDTSVTTSAATNSTVASSSSTVTNSTATNNTATNSSATNSTATNSTATNTTFTTLVNTTTSIPVSVPAVTTIDIVFTLALTDS